MNERFYLLKIQLNDVEPAVWRRFVVPATITLDRLHDVAQIVMGWQDKHLFEFTIGTKRYTENPESKEEGLPCDRYRLGDLMKQKGRTFSYGYDFGDGWDHEIVLEDSRVKPVYAMGLGCQEGARACPPEDVGGPGGYLEYVGALKNRRSNRNKALVDWFGGDFDPEEFDVDLINMQLMMYFRWSRDRHYGWKE